MTSRTREKLLFAGVAVAIALALYALVQAGMADYQVMGVTHLSSLHLSDAGATATPVFIADQQGTGAIAVFEDAGTPVASWYDGGATNWTGAMDFDSTLNVDGAVTCNSTLDVDGNISSGTGAITMTDSVNVTDTVDLDSSLNVDGAVTLNSTLDVDGNISSGTGAITVTDDLVVDDTFLISAQTAISVEQEGWVITPTGTYQPLESADDYSSTLETSGFTAGTLVVLINTVDHRLGITDTSTAKLSGNLYLDQYDSAIIWFDGTNWIQLAETDN